MLITERKLRTIIRSVLKESSMSDTEKVPDSKNIIYVPQGNWNNIIKIMKRDFPEIESFKNLTASKLAAAYNNKTLKVGEGLDVPQLIEKLNGELDGIPKIYSHKELKYIESQNSMNSIFDQDAMGLDKAASHMTGKDDPSLFEKYMQIMQTLYTDAQGNQNSRVKIQNQANKIREKYEDDPNNPDLHALLKNAHTLLDAKNQVSNKAWAY